MEQRLLHTDGKSSPPRPAGYWTELLHCHRAHIVLHLVGPEVTPQEPIAVCGDGDDGGSLRVECHATDALSFLTSHEALLQRKPAESGQPPCVCIAYHPGFGTVRNTHPPFLPQTHARPLCKCPCIAQTPDRG